MKRFVAIVVLTALAPLAAAQQKSPRPGPADPAAPVPPAKYESAFTGYVPFREQALVPWRGVNDEVGRVGGHIGIVGGATSKPAPKPGQGHK